MRTHQHMLTLNSEWTNSGSTELSLIHFFVEPSGLSFLLQGFPLAVYCNILLMTELSDCDDCGSRWSNGLWTKNVAFSHLWGGSVLKATKSVSDNSNSVSSVHFEKLLTEICSYCYYRGKYTHSYICTIFHKSTHTLSLTHTQEAAEL